MTGDTSGVGSLSFVCSSPDPGGTGETTLNPPCATGAPLYTTWGPVAGLGGTPLPGNILGPRKTLALHKAPGQRGVLGRGLRGGVRICRPFGARWLAQQGAGPWCLKNKHSTHTATTSFAGRATAHSRGASVPIFSRSPCEQVGVGRARARARARAREIELESDVESERETRARARREIPFFIIQAPNHRLRMHAGE